MRSQAERDSGPPTDTGQDRVLDDVQRHDVDGVTFGIAGVLQSYLERGLGMGYMTVQSYMRPWMGVTIILGAFFLAGAGVTVVDLLFMKPETRRA